MALPKTLSKPSSPSFKEKCIKVQYACVSLYEVYRDRKSEQPRKKMNFSTVHACKCLTIADWEYDCAYCVFSWGDPVGTRKLYSPQCQTAPTPLALHIHPLVPLAHSALSALAGSLSGSTNGRAHTNTDTHTHTNTNKHRERESYC